ncbi:hypothetical protein ADK41_33225 [Streptomyces caelestis]|uniref:Uncharacterized protein n=2 Tax=Streptomyces TaxID=1883 RepID=A0A0M8QE49_9ACTN|nr:hypothetical protein ADK41_33225 [Streptomyces caelestis]
MPRFRMTLSHRGASSAVSDSASHRSIGTTAMKMPEASAIRLAVANRLRPWAVLGEKARPHSQPATTAATKNETMMDRYGRSPSSDISEARIMTVDRRPKHPHAPQAALASVGSADVVVEALGEGDRVLSDVGRVGMPRVDPVERSGLRTASEGFRPVQ